MEFLLLLFFTLCFPIFIFCTTILYTSDLTPILKTDLVKNHIYGQLSNQLGKLDTGDSNSPLVSQFLQNKFTTQYLQGKVEKALNDSDDWVRGRTDTPPVISFKDVKDELNAQYPQLLPDIQQAAEKLKEEEAQNPKLAQQNPQAAQNLDMIVSLTKSNFTIPLNKYLIGLKDFYTTIRILQPVLAILLILCLILQSVMNQTWPGRLKWIGFTLLFGSLWGLTLAFGNVALITVLASYAEKISNHNLQMATPILLQLINHYVDAFAKNQKTASTAVFCVAVVCFVCAIFSNKQIAPAKTKVAKKK